ncbi:endolysin [Gordonia phage GMA2]|uniref:Lysin B n=1 Tax=Gordonia phage GMA2 TaxID=1647283 RepID=A0A0K0N6P8_9CAUD|nr:endolysin [Gordonia phage GMA2]AKJ72614.1 hypothetical protein GMA2_76 [Gordonia phage GMA2]
MALIIMVGGTGENPKNSYFLDSFLRPYITRADRVVRVDYPAAIGPANIMNDPLNFENSAKHSREAAKKTLAQLIRSTSDVPILAGYSLGAWALSEFLEELAQGKHRNMDGTLLQVKSAILVANPRRGRVRKNGPYGIAGAHKPYPKNLRYVDIATPMDVIPLCPADSSLRFLPYIADVLTARLDETTLTSWTTLAKSGLFQAGVPSLRDLRYLNKYLDGTAHVKDYFGARYVHQASTMFS